MKEESNIEGEKRFKWSTDKLRCNQYVCQDYSNRFTFLDRDGQGLVDGKPQFRSLPILLEERRNGIWKIKRKKWQHKMLFSFTNKPEDANVGRRQWRAFARRRIPFTRLGSPISDAVLAMDRNSDYVLTLGNMNGTNSGLALRFYGIHSAASKMRRHSSIRNGDSSLNDVLKAPLLQTIPLECGMGCSPSTTSVELMISKDWKVGVALLHRTRSDSSLPLDSQDINNNQDSCNIASMVFFSLPRRQKSSTKIGDVSVDDINPVFKYSHVSEFFNDFQRKMLWSVESIPNKDENSPNSSNYIYNTCFCNPGYLIFNDEGKGFRLTWATEKCFLVPSSLCEVSLDCRFLVGSRNFACVNILSHQDNSSWVEERGNSMTDG